MLVKAITFYVKFFHIMYISRRFATVRNVSVSTVNGGITLVILLIAPLGLAAVIINTLLVTFFYLFSLQYSG